jgi:hypothetical protein
MALFLAIAPLFAASPRADERSPAPKKAKVFFLDLKDGQTIPAKMTIHFGISGMDLAAAGSSKPNSGHHHLLIDTELPPLDQPIPSDFNHIHFGRGQDEMELSLTAGEHTLQLLLGDGNHVAHDPPVVSPVIHVFVDPATVKKTLSPSPGDRAKPNSGHHHPILDSGGPETDGKVEQISIVSKRAVHLGDDIDQISKKISIDVR